jgi:ribonuclease HI
MQNEIHIYTDGSSRGNPGRGGYGVVLLYGNHRKELSGGFEKTTNNRMELMAVIEGLKTLKKTDLPITVFSDSKYVVEAVTKGWLQTWIQTAFKGGKKNKDLWMKYYNLAKPLQIKFVWIKGHAENPFNNRCDQLATQAADSSKLAVDSGFENADALFSI